LRLEDGDVVIRRVIIFHTGGMVVSRQNLCEALPAKRAFHPFSCALIDHSEAGWILFDTGLGARTQALLERRPMRLIHRWVPIVYDESMQLLHRLEALGVAPQDVTRVLMSHLHLDHTGGMADLPWATFTVARAEWEMASQMRPLRGMLRGYVLDDFRHANIQMIEYPLPSPIWPFTQGHDVLGDGSLILLPTPGHTPGHQSLLVTWASGRRVLLAGDAVYVHQNYMFPADQGRLIRRLRWDHAQTWRTMLKIRALWQRTPDVTIIPAHDMRLGERLAEAPWDIV